MELPTSPLSTGHEPARPLALHRETVRHEWVDYNNHMNVAYYVLVFDHATDAFLDHVGLGTAYREATGCSVFVAEAHITYEQEVSEGDPLQVTTRVLGFDGKRLILFHQMFRGDDAEPAATPVATNEVLCLHVDLGVRRTAPLPAEAAKRLAAVAAKHASLPAPAQAGRSIRLDARRPR